jgi:hypothetical protein
VFPHESTAPGPVSEKSALIRKLGMNPWPVHLTSTNEPESWRSGCARLVEGVRAILDTGGLTLWRLPALSREVAPGGPFLVLVASPVRQHRLGLRRIFGWISRFTRRGHVARRSGGPARGVARRRDRAPKRVLACPE